MPRPGFTRRSRRPTVLASATATDRSIIFMVSISHRPGGRDRKTRAHRAARNCVYEHDGATLSLVIARLAAFAKASAGQKDRVPRRSLGADGTGRPRIPEAAVIEPGRRGVLDTPACAGYDDSYDCPLLRSPRRVNHRKRNSRRHLAGAALACSAGRCRLIVASRCYLPFRGAGE